MDILLTGGLVVDGTGAALRRADVGVQDDRIVEVGLVDHHPSAKVVDVSGKVVSPGFVDVHNHSDGWLRRTKCFEPKVSQGFTTEVIMADGISYAPVAADTAVPWIVYLQALNGLRTDHYQGWQSLEDYVADLDGRTAQNVLFHIPYANVRALHTRFMDPFVDDFQTRSIHAEIIRGMEAGAVGISTGLDYVAQCVAATDELAAACSLLRSYQGCYATHIRYKIGLLPAVREAVEIGRRAGVAVHISHLKASTPQQNDELFQYIDNVARKEVDFTFDVYPYAYGSTMLNYLLPYDVWNDGPLGAIDRLQDADLRRRFHAGLNAYRINLDAIRIAWLPSRGGERFLGWSLQRFIDESGKAPADALCDLLIEERLAVLCILEEGTDDLLRSAVTHDCFMLGSDGIYHPHGPVHPRVYGSDGQVGRQSRPRLEVAVLGDCDCRHDRPSGATIRVGTTRQSRKRVLCRFGGS